MRSRQFKQMFETAGERLQRDGREKRFAESLFQTAELVTAKLRALSTF